MNQSELAKTVPALQPLLEPANHVDIKTVVSDISLREFLAGMFAYYPGWIKQLYRVRWGFVRLLSMRQEGIPEAMHLAPADIPMQAGEKLAFFTVTTAVPGQYWVAEAAESHLTAYLAVVVEPAASGKRFHVVTIVHYHRWTGPVYFNAIRPFHHLVVRKMVQAGANAATDTAVADVS